VIDGVCLHRSATVSNPEEARGFFGAEILEAHGDEAFVESCCNSCPANAIEDSQPEAWAGCYGWLPATPKFQFDVTEEAAQPYPAPLDGQSDELVVMLDEVVNDQGLGPSVDDLFKRTSPRWYGIWRTNRFRDQQLECLLEVFTHLADRFETRPADLDHFVSALSRCVKHKLELHAELVPPGFSDGQVWQLSGYCPDCSCELKTSGQQKCPACGRYGHPHEIRKSKVLGLRPYVFLNGVIGESKTVELLQKLNATNRD